MKKIRNNRGETLIEVLASILIATLSVTLLFGCIMISSGMDMTAKGMDEVHYTDFTNADTKQDGRVIPEGSTTFAVTIEKKNPDDPDGVPVASTDLEIAVYGGEGMHSYKRAGS